MNEMEKDFGFLSAKNKKNLFVRVREAGMGRIEVGLKNIYNVN